MVAGAVRGSWCLNRTMHFLLAFFVAIFGFHTSSVAQTGKPVVIKRIEISTPARLIVGKQYTKSTGVKLKIRFIGRDDELNTRVTGKIRVTSGGLDISKHAAYEIQGGEVAVDEFTMHAAEVTVEYQGHRVQKTLAVAGWWSLVPPLAAIILALLFRQVLIALFGGIWLGQAAIAMTQPGFNLDEFIGKFFGLLPALSETVVGELANADHAKTILFTLIMGGMVGIISRAGGMRAVVDVIARYAQTARSAQIATWMMGLCIFFDDYANTILVGNTMRPFTDRFRISREKLAFIVDCTAAPVAALFLISTWIGYEVGLIAEMLEAANIDQVGYSVFVQSVPYRFYSILCLFMVLVVAWLGRDFGPMLSAERRARLTGKVVSDSATPMLNTAALEEFSSDTKAHWCMAAIPVGVMIATVAIALLITGHPRAYEKAQAATGRAEAALGISGEGVSFPDRLDALQSIVQSKSDGEEVNITVKREYESAIFYFSITGYVSEADAYNALTWGAGLGTLAAAILALCGGLLTLSGCCDGFMDGLRAMLLAVVVLTLAWGLGSVCSSLQTGAFIAEGVRFVPAWLLPTLVFVISAAIAFCTGTSWGTMAIVFPVIGPLLAAATGNPAFESILYGSVGAVLAGACFGDHASPISDTTVLSSMSSGSDHIDHVRTQFPYAATAGVVAIIFGFLPAGFGISPLFGLGAGALSIVAIFWFIGESAEPETPVTANE